MRASTLLRCLTSLSTALAVSACGEGDLIHREVVSGDFGVYRANLTVGQAGGCSTSVVQGLTQQLIEELNCLAPNLMVDFSGSHTNLYSAVNPYLAPGASSGLKKATQQKNDTITISSAYRSLAQQYLLYRWWKNGQCGIQLAATPGSSNHQSGRAIDTPYYSYWKTALANNGWSWLGSSDVVHFDHNASPNVASNSIKAFQRLWNKNRANKLVEDGQWGPATESAMASSPASGFTVHGCVTSGKLNGAIYSGGNTSNRVSGAEVTVGNQSVTTGSDGLYTFTLPPGTYTVSVQKSGYTTQSVSRAVTAGATTWGSMEINPVATTGTLSGVVTTGSPAQPVGGATVATAGKTQTTGADGAFTFTLPKGSYTLSVVKDGFEPASATHAVTAGQQTTATFTLTPAQGDAPPMLSISGPEQALSTELARVTLHGTATDESALQSVQLSLNSAEAVTVPVEAGSFVHELKLAPGQNEVIVSATDAAGQTTSATWTGEFRAGLSGVVRRYDLKEAIIANAKVTLVDDTTGAELASDTTDDAGRFELDLAQVPGHFGLSVSAEGFVTHARSIEVTDEARASVDVALAPGEDGVFSIRFIEPAPGAVVDATETNVSGVVSGIQVETVTVNGVEAMLIGDSAFLAKAPLEPGTNVYQVVATSNEGHAVTASVEVTRPLGQVTGSSCGAAPGGVLLPLLALGGILAHRRTRRRTRDAALRMD